MPTSPLVLPLVALLASAPSPFADGTGAPNAGPVAAAGPDQQAAAVGCTARVRLDGSGSSDPDGDALRYLWWSDNAAMTGADVEMDLPVGEHTITLTVTDTHGARATDSVVVTVLPDPAPALAIRATATPDVLDPPNRRMIPVGVAVELSGGCEAATTCSISGVVSTYPDEGKAPDWAITGSMTLLLRAEGDPRAAAGRVYTVNVGCRGPSGEESAAAATVLVPRN